MMFCWHKWEVTNTNIRRVEKPLTVRIGGVSCDLPEYSEVYVRQECLRCGWVRYNVYSGADNIVIEEREKG